MTKVLLLPLFLITLFVGSSIAQAGGNTRTRDYTVWPPAAPKTSGKVVVNNPSKPVTVPSNKTITKGK